ncbi:MAG: signal peptidase I [Lachnospiraceae bacterium]|nr:signal peptidase I [Lachnospiraceae bacterium]
MNVPDKEKNKDKNTNKEKNRRRTDSRLTSAAVQRFLIQSGILVAALFLVFTFLISVNRAEGNTMSPFVRDGDLCIFLKTDQPSLGEVVLYRNEKGERRIGRIAATEGQAVDFPETGGYLVDGYLYPEENPYETRPAEESDVEYPFRLSSKEVFILNDFRSITEDSRSFGPVGNAAVEGTLFFLLRRRGF